MVTALTNQFLPPAVTVKVQAKEVKRSLTTPLPAVASKVLSPTVTPV